MLNAEVSSNFPTSNLLQHSKFSIQHFPASPLEPEGDASINPPMVWSEVIYLEAPDVGPDQRALSQRHLRAAPEIPGDLRRRSRVKREGIRILDVRVRPLPAQSGRRVGRHADDVEV